jgi:hypothetical protein
MILTKLELMWTDSIEGFEFVGMRMFKVTDVDHANRVCFEEGKNVEWDASDADPQDVLAYIRRNGDAASGILANDIEENLSAGATLIRFRFVGDLTELWMAL